MSLLIVAKMPLLISSRMTSATLTPSSSPSSLTVIVAGSSTAPRADGSTTWTAVCATAPSRRCGLRGPRRPRVPLLLRAIGHSSADGGHQLGCEIRGHLGFERPPKAGPRRRALDARLVAADVRPATVGATRLVEPDTAIGRADDAQQLALGAAGAAVDAGSGRDGSTFEHARC